jgi:hypothetical protein
VTLIGKLHRFFILILHPQQSSVAVLAIPASVTVQFISEDLGQNSAEDYRLAKMNLSELMRPEFPSDAFQRGERASFGRKNVLSLAAGSRLRSDLLREFV